MFLPANSSNKTQPMDISVNKPLKDKIKILWEFFMAKNDKVTKSGYVKSVCRQTFISWVDEAWGNIKLETISNGFKHFENKINEICID